MPSFPYSRALTANQLGDEPLSTWLFERIPVLWGNGAFVKVLQRATTTGARTTIFSGSTNVQQRSPIQGGGTAGTTPAQLNTPPIDFVALPDDKLTIQNDEVAGGTPTIDGIVAVEPA